MLGSITISGTPVVAPVAYPAPALPVCPPPRLPPSAIPAPVWAETIAANAALFVGIQQGQPGPPGPAGPGGAGSIYNEALTIIEQNVIPPLSKPWKAAPGAFANIIIGAATLVSGQGAVTFHDGSTTVDFNADPSTGGAGFNINIGDVVVAQYNVA